MYTVHLAAPEFSCLWKNTLSIGITALSGTYIISADQKTQAMPDTQPRPFISVVMGSVSDWTVMKRAVETLRHFDVRVETRVISAQRICRACLRRKRRRPSSAYRFLALICRE